MSALSLQQSQAKYCLETQIQALVFRFRTQANLSDFFFFEEGTW